MRVVVSAVVLLVVVPRLARGDDPVASPPPGTTGPGGVAERVVGEMVETFVDAVDAAIHLVTNVVPASAGIDVDVHNDGRVRGLVSWAMQIPIDGHTDDWWMQPRDSRHRVVVAPELTFGRESEPGVTFGFELRAGYRFVVHPGRSSLGLLAGIGGTATFAPELRAAISPELGVHLGRVHEFGFLTFIVRCDAFLDGDRAMRLGGQLGWSWL